MTKKEIRNAAKEMILAGSMRQQAFEAVLASSKEKPEVVAPLVRYIPTMAAREKYHTAWVTLIVAMMITVLGKVFLAFQVISENGNAWWPMLLLAPLLNVLLTIGVIQHRGEVFRWIGFLSVIGLMRGIANNAAGGFDGFFLIDALLAVLIISVAFYLNARMVPDSTEVKERYTNAQGQERLRNKLVFGER